MTDAPKPLADDRQNGPTRRAGRRGRRIAIGVYWVAIAYITVVGFHSVVRQVFFPELAASAAELGPLPEHECRAGLASLRQDLLDHSARHVRDGGGGSPSPWLAQWDRRFRVLTTRCDHPAQPPLERLRYRIETTLHRFDREEARLAQEVSLQLRSSSAASSHENR